MAYQQIWPGWDTVRLIGTGGFGKVYEIEKRDTAGTFRAALKIITVPQSDEEYRLYEDDGYDERSITSIFQSQIDDIVSEFRIMSQFKGTANIVSYEDHMIVPHDDGRGWDILIRMELLTPLPKVLRDGELSEKDARKLGTDICRALEMCAMKDIVHRDIKPQNIFVNDFGDYKLGDFGIARVMDHTTQATKIGTCTYMAPEVYKSQPYNAAADVYSLGLVMYWMLNGRRLPFLPLPPQVPTAAQNNEALIRRLNGAPIPRPANGSDEIWAVIKKALSYDPKDRYQTAKEMHMALRDIAAGHAEGEDELYEEMSSEDKPDHTGEQSEKAKSREETVRATEYIKAESDDRSQNPQTEGSYGKSRQAAAPKKRKGILLFIGLAAIIAFGIILMVPRHQNTYTVNWNDGDGSVLDSQSYKKGEAEPTTSKVPTRADDETNSYTFSGWDDGTLTDNGTIKVYKPVFTATPLTYTVNWLDGDGTVLDSRSERKGEAESTTDKIPTRADDENYSYTFNHWGYGIWNEDRTVKTYKPVFTEEPEKLKQWKKVCDDYNERTKGKESSVWLMDFHELGELMEREGVLFSTDYHDWEGTEKLTYVIDSNGDERLYLLFDNWQVEIHDVLGERVITLLRDHRQESIENDEIPETIQSILKDLFGLESDRDVLGQFGISAEMLEDGIITNDYDSWTDYSYVDMVEYKGQTYDVDTCDYFALEYHPYELDIYRHEYGSDKPQDDIDLDLRWYKDNNKLYLAMIEMDFSD